MTLYQVWYMKPDWFISGTFGKKPDPNNISETHVHLKDIEVEFTTPKSVIQDLEIIWVRMQGEMWSPNGEARPLIEEKGLRHTSMSVGDLIVKNTSREIWLCKNAGFELIGRDVPWDTDGDTSQWNENGEADEANNDRLASRNYRD
jgi:hypothetical protein